MFDFALQQQQRRTLTGRLIVSWIASCLAHFALLMILILNPQILRPGSGHWIRSMLVFEAEPQEPEWRTVAILRTEPMQAPSAATLRKYMKNWNEDESEGGSTPPIRISWAGEEESASSPPAPIPAPVVRPIEGTQEPSPPPASAAAPPIGDLESSTASEVSRAAIALEPAPANAPPSSKTVYLPAPSPAEPKPALPSTVKSASEETPSALPAPRPLVPDQAVQEAAAQQNARIFQDEQSAIRTEGSGLFDTQGFPLGDYASIVIERVKGNWSIPSNLRNSQGRTTVVFFIAKDGGFTDARIVSSSGSSSLDLAALNAVIGSNPFPPLPKGFPGNQVGAKFVFSYNERRQ